MKILKELISGIDNIYNKEDKSLFYKNTSRYSLEYKIWREEVFKRDKYTCQVCKRKAKYLNAHHVLGYAKFESKRLDVENGITLCSLCHYKFHEKYGKSNFPNINNLIKENNLDFLKIKKKKKWKKKK